MCQSRKIAYLGWDLRVVEVIVNKVKLLQVNKMKESAVRVDSTKETTITEVKANHVACVLITVNTIPRATISTIFSFWCPRSDPITCIRKTGSRLVYGKALLEFQQG